MDYIETQSKESVLLGELMVSKSRFSKHLLKRTIFKIQNYSRLGFSEVTFFKFQKLIRKGIASFV